MEPKDTRSNIPVILICSFAITVILVIVYTLWYTYCRRYSDIYDLPRNLANFYFYGIVTYVGDGDGFRVYHTPCLRSDQTTEKGSSRKKERDRSSGKGASRNASSKKQEVPSSGGCCAPQKSPTLKIRLAGIDAPEIRHFNVPGQPYAVEAKNFLKSLIYQKKVYIKTIEIDMYQRVLSIVYIKTGLFSWTNVNIKMVEEGYACVYEGKDAQYGDIRAELEKAEMRARNSKRGMWKNKNYMSPMEHKKNARRLV